MILHEINMNAILVEPMKNRSSGEMSKAYKKLMDQLNVANIYRKKIILNNDGSDDFLQHIMQAGIIYKKVPSHMY